MNAKNKRTLVIVAVVLVAAPAAIVIANAVGGSAAAGTAARWVMAIVFGGILALGAWAHIAEFLGLDRSPPRRPGE